MRLIWDEDGKKYGLADPQKDDIVARINALNNSQHTMVALDLSGEGCLLVIGGEAGRVRVNYIPEDLNIESRHVVDPEYQGEALALKMQSDSRTYQPQHTANKETAIKAMLDYLATREPSLELRWVAD